MRVVVTGGAGFVGSHLCTRFLDEDHEVVCIDNLITGAARNVEHLVGRRGFTFIEYDVTNYLHVPGGADLICHFASPASPRDYLDFPIQTLKVGALGTHKTLGLAKATGAKYLLASTSEVYGDPLVNPQPETYWGNVNPVGPRGVYDEAKRFGEAMAMAYHRTHGVDVKIVRIFNTYGTRMRTNDGRAVPEFLRAALTGQPLEIHGDGTQTRSFTYVDDLVDGLVRLAASSHNGPMNIGNDDEMTVLDAARLIIEITGSGSEIKFGPRPVDDPTVRRPDLTLARSVLGWSPTTPVRVGLERTAEWFEKELART